MPEIPESHCLSAFEQLPAEVPFHSMPNELYLTLSLAQLQEYYPHGYSVSRWDITAAETLSDGTRVTALGIIYRYDFPLGEGWKEFIAVQDEAGVVFLVTGEEFAKMRTEMGRNGVEREAMRYCSGGTVWGNTAGFEETDGFESAAGGQSH